MRFGLLALALAAAVPASAQDAASAAPRRVALVMVDEDPGTPGLVMSVPGTGRAESSAAHREDNRAAVKTGVRQLLDGSGSDILAQAKIGAVDGKDHDRQFPTEWLKLDVAHARLDGCAAFDPEDLGSRGAREYFLVRLKCAKPVAGWDWVYLGVGVENKSVKIIYLNQGHLMSAFYAEDVVGG